MSGSEGAPGTAMAKLVIATNDSPREFSLGDDPVGLGREPENEIQLDRPDVSRRHCRIEPLPQGGYRVLDLGSKNGTFLNGRQITAMALEYDDRMRVGEVLVVYVDDDTDPKEALERGSDEDFLPFSPTNRFDSAAVGSSDDDMDTWRRSRRKRPDADPTEGSVAPRGDRDDGPGHTRSSNRSYLKERLVRLGLLSQNIASELDLSRLLDTILDEVLDFTGFERGLLLYGEEGVGRLKPVLGRNMDHEHLDDAARSFSRGLVEEALREKRIVFRSGIATADSSFSARESVVSMGLESALCIPLSAPMRMTQRGAKEDRRRSKRRRRILGAIYLDSTFPIRTLDDADLRLLEAVAAQAAIALQNARLHYQATTDPLTGLSNRGFIKQVFEDELRQARQNKDSLGVLLLDLDHFKRINDTYGHGTGDEVLKRVAQRIRRTIRRDDYAGRWGGEEFVVVLPGEGLAGVLTVAEKIADAIKSRPFGEARVQVTTSIGISVYPEHGKTQGELLKRADQALYAAKDAGRDRSVVFSPELDRADHRTDAVSGIFDADPAHTHRNLTAIFDTIENLRSARDPQEVLDRTLDNVIDLTRARRALLIAKDPSTERLAVTASRSQGGGPLLGPDAAEFSRSAVQTALDESRSLCVLDAGSEEARQLSSSSIDKLGLNTVMVVPLLAGGRTLGVLYADDTTARREFSHLDLAHLEVMAHQLAMSLSANPELRAAALGAAEDDLDETTKLRHEVERLRRQIEEMTKNGE